MANAYIIAAKATISFHNGPKYLNHAEVIHTPRRLCLHHGDFANVNIVNRTAGQ